MWGRALVPRLATPTSLKYNIEPHDYESAKNEYNLNITIIYNDVNTPHSELEC